MKRMACNDSWIIKPDSTIYKCYLDIPNALIFYQYIDIVGNNIRRNWKSCTSTENRYFHMDKMYALHGNIYACYRSWLTASAFLQHRGHFISDFQPLRQNSLTFSTYSFCFWQCTKKKKKRLMLKIKLWLSGQDGCLGGGSSHPCPCLDPAPGESTLAVNCNIIQRCIQWRTVKWDLFEMFQMFYLLMVFQSKLLLHLHNIIWNQCSLSSTVKQKFSSKIIFLIGFYLLC